MGIDYFSSGKIEENVERFSAETRREGLILRIEAALREVEFALSLAEPEAIEEIVGLGVELERIKEALLDIDPTRVSMRLMENRMGPVLDRWKGLSGGVYGMAVELEGEINPRIVDADRPVSSRWERKSQSIHNLLAELLRPDLQEDRRASIERTLMEDAADWIDWIDRAEYEVEENELELGGVQHRVRLLRFGPGKVVWMVFPETHAKSAVATTVLALNGLLQPGFEVLCRQLSLSELDQAQLAQLARVFFERSLARSYGEDTTSLPSSPSTASGGSGSPSARRQASANEYAQEQQWLVLVEQRRGEIKALLDCIYEIEGKKAPLSKEDSDWLLTQIGELERLQNQLLQMNHHALEGLVTTLGSLREHLHEMLGD